MNNHHTPTRGPTTRCKAFAALLPLLDEPDMDADALAGARAHLAACAYCQQQRAAYRQLEAAAVRYLRPPAIPQYQTEEIMRDLLEQPAAAPGDVETATSPKIHPLPRKPADPRRLISNLAPLAAVLVIVILTVTLFASRSHFPGGSTSSTPTPATITESRLLDVAMVSPTEGWAVGYSISFTFLTCTVRSDQGNRPISCGIENLGQGTVLLMHYMHGTWTPIHLPLHGQLTSISMLSATDGWAIGNVDNSPDDLFLHYDGHTWKQVHANAPPVFGTHQLLMLSDTDGWAISFSVWHFDGHLWAAQPLPASLRNNTQTFVTMQAVSMTSPTEGWAVGFMQPPVLQGTPPPQREIDTGIILHYLNGQWSLYRTIPNAMPKDVKMTSPDDGWIAGSNEVGDGSPMLLHYTHGAWTQVSNPLSAADSRGVAFERIFMRSPTDGWMTIGTGVNFQESATVRYDGSQWRVDRLPIIPEHAALEITSISMTSANDGWAVGARTPANASPGSNAASFATDPLLLHYHNGAWHIYNNS